MSERPDALGASGVTADAPRLVLLRHGQSEWNAKSVFTGWADPDLTEAGKRDAVRAGHVLGAQGRLSGPVGLVEPRYTLVLAAGAGMTVALAVSRQAPL